MVENLVIRKQALYRYSVKLLIDILYQMGCDMRNTFRVNNTDIYAWNAFIEHYESASKDFVRRFILFQLNCKYGSRNGAISRTTLSRTRLAWLVSKKAIDSWEKVNPEFANKLTSKQLKSRFELTTVSVKSSIPDIATKLIEREEKAKSEFINTNKGLAWCVANTTLYHHKSRWCVSCRFNGECKEMLRLNYPLIYKIRGYAER